MENENIEMLRVISCHNYENPPNLDNKNKWSFLRIICYILLIILTVLRVLFVPENKIVFSFLLIMMYGISLFINKYCIGYIFSIITICFFFNIFCEENELLFFYFWQIYVLSLFTQNALEKKYHNIIYIMPWTRFLWIFYFTDNFKENYLFLLDANCYSVIALIFDTIFFFFYEKSNIEKNVNILEIYRLYNWLFFIIYMASYRYSFFVACIIFILYIIYILYILISFIANESVKNYSKKDYFM